MTPSPDWKDRGPGDSGSQDEDRGDQESLAGRFEEEQELLRRHVRILRAVRENEPVGIIKLSELTEEPQHKVRYSLRVLEEEGLIEPTSMGARTTDLLSAFMPKLEEVIASMQEEAEALRKAAD